MASDIWGELVLMMLSLLLYGMCNGMEVALRATQKSRLLQWKEESRYGAASGLQNFVGFVVHWRGVG